MNNKLILLLVIFVLIIYSLRVDEYVGLSDSKVTILHNKDLGIDSLDIYFLIEKKVPTREQYYDTIPVFIKDKQIIQSLPDEYGPNGFFVNYKGHYQMLRVGVFKALTG